MKIKSASLIAGSMSVVKNKLRPRHSLTMSSSPGWYESEIILAFHWIHTSQSIICRYYA